MRSLLSDLQSKHLIAAKGILFLGLALLCLGLLLVDSLSLRQWCLILIAIWACCRFYYFLFYVIEKYLDPSYKFSGLRSVLVYLTALLRRNARHPKSRISTTQEEKQ